MNNKKGISAVVATVLIILITVAAVTIIWAAIIPMINNQLGSSTICLDAVSQVTIEDAGYTCYDAVTDSLNLQIKHGAKDFDLAGVQVLISVAGNTASNDVTTGLPGPNEEKVIVITDAMTTADLTTMPEKVEIAPIVTVGNTQQTCDISSSIVVVEC